VQWKEIVQQKPKSILPLSINGIKIEKAFTLRNPSSKAELNN